MPRACPASCCRNDPSLTDLEITGAGLEEAFLAITAPPPTPAGGGPMKTNDGLVPASKPYALEAKYEFLKQLRMPAYAIPAITFPVMFYLLFGVMFGGGRPAGSTTVATYMLATYGAFGVIGSALFGFGVGVAVERGQGWMTLKRATPMPPLAYFVAKLAMRGLFAAIIVLLLSLAGVTARRRPPARRPRGCALVVTLIAGHDPVLRARPRARIPRRARTRRPRSST